jgi:hypothetical protein
MMPRTAKKKIPFQDGRVFFGQLEQGEFHARSRLGYASVAPSIGDPYPVIDAKGTTLSGGGGAKEWRGVEITTAASGSLSYEAIGVAVKIIAPNAASISPNMLRYMGEERVRRFGAHLEHALGSSQLANLYLTTPTSEQGLYNIPAAYTSDNSFAQGVQQQGSLGALIRTDTIYRTGAASAPDTDHSYLFAGLSNCVPATMRTSPFFLFHNTLTGSRTLTLRFLTDSAWDNDITNLDIWADVFYPSSATNPKYSLATSENANFGVPAAVPTAVATDSSGWTYSGIFFPTAWKIEIALSPQRVGFFFIRFNIASIKLSRYLTYIDPFFAIA